MSTTTIAPCPPCPTALTAAQLETYHRDGWLAFHDVLSPDEVETAKSTISELIPKLYRDPATSRDVQLEIGVDGSQVADDQLELHVRKLTRYRDRHPFFANLTRHHPRMRGVVESIIGANPLLYLNMALLKPAHIGSEKPWHQDDSYFLVVPLDAICGVWIALDEATADNGCMWILPGGHRLGPLRHDIIPDGQENNDCVIAPGRFDTSKAIPVELPAGGAMFFHGLLPHTTKPNSSPYRRRALQYHYRAANSTITDREQFDKLFVEPDGIPAACAYYKTQQAKG